VEELNPIVSQLKRQPNERVSNRTKSLIKQKKERLFRACIFDGCSCGQVAKGLCWGHWRQQRRGQSLRPLGMGIRPELKPIKKGKRTRNSGDNGEPSTYSVRMCGGPACTFEARTRGYCAGHARQLEDGKSLTPLKKRTAKHVGCTIVGCLHDHYARGFCRNHYSVYWSRRKKLDTASNTAE